MPSPEHNNNVSPLIELLDGLNPFHEIEGVTVPVSVTPPGYEVRAHEYLLPQPTRVRRTQEFSTLASFRAYLDENAQERTSAYCKIGSLFQRTEQTGDAAKNLNPHFTAIIDDDFGGPDGGNTEIASWRSHQATYQPLTSDQMRRWYKSNRVKFGQKEFAEFIEDNIADIAGEEGAKLLQVATTFDSAAEIVMKSSVRLDNGMVEYTYTEKDSDKVAKVKVPSKFMIYIPMYYGGGAVSLVCRLKYRASQGGVLFFYEIENGAAREIEEFNRIVATVKGEGDKTVRVYEASAPAALK